MIHSGEHFGNPGFAFLGVGNVGLVRMLTHIREMVSDLSVLVDTTRGCLSEPEVKNEDLIQGVDWPSPGSD